MVLDTHLDPFKPSAVHCPNIDHEVYVFPEADLEVYSPIETIAKGIYDHYAPQVRAPPETTATLDGEFRWAILRYCVGRCRHPEKQELEAQLELWDKLDEHAERASVRFTVYLQTDVIGSCRGGVFGLRREWARALQSVKAYTRAAMWRQVRQWERYDNPGAKQLGGLPDNWKTIWDPLRKQIAAGNWEHIDRLPRWDDTVVTERNIYQERDGDFGLKNKMRPWTYADDLPKDPQTGQVLQVRPRGVQGHLIPYEEIQRRRSKLRGAYYGL